MTLTIKQEGIYIDDSILNSIISSDGLIFDCDGVLIDITKSYDLTIEKTTKLVLGKFANISEPIEIDSQIIEGFKSTGGFNDEVDVTYASIISLYSHQIFSIGKFEPNIHLSELYILRTWLTISLIKIGSFLFIKVPKPDSFMIKLSNSDKAVINSNQIFIKESAEPLEGTQFILQKSLKID